MGMSKSDVVELTTEVLLPKAQAEWTRLDKLDGWLRWNPEQIDVPRHASQEQKGLRDLAESGWMRLVISNLAQQLFAEQCSSSMRKKPEGEIVAPVMRPWMTNRMESRQRAIHRAALGYGYSYTTVMPGDTGSVIRGRSPRDMFAVYQDPVVDEYPMYYVLKSGPNGFLVVDEDTEFTLQRSDRGVLKYITEEAHDTGVAPAIRYSNQIDLEGRTPGEVEPLIKEAKRVHKTTYDRLLQQHFNSWKVRYATGLDMPEDEDERKRIKAVLEHDSILVGEGDVNFGTLDETVLDGIIKAEDRDVESFAAIAQTPAHALTGKMVNLSADAISEARAMLDLKAGERKLGFGDSHVQTLRLAAHQEGREEDANDFSLRMEWRDLGSRSLTQAADALGKMATMLGIPVQKLWSRLPGVTPDEAAEWEVYAREHPSAEAQMAAALQTQSNGTNG
jgi:hypothetical protein